MNCSDPEVADLVIKKRKRVRPLGARVLVKVIPVEDVMENGLYKPEIAQEKPQEGWVIAVGKGRIVNGERIPVDVEVGQKVLFGKYCGNEVSVDGENHLLIQEDELQGVIDEE